MTEISILQFIILASTMIQNMLKELQNSVVGEYDGIYCFAFEPSNAEEIPIEKKYINK